MKGIKVVLGENIKLYRKKQRISQEKLAEKLGITPKHLSAIETGSTFISADLLENLTKQLRVSASALFYSAGEVSSDESLFGKIDQIIDSECGKTSVAIKLQIRHLS